MCGRNALEDASTCEATQGSAGQTQQSTIIYLYIAIAAITMDLRERDMQVMITVDGNRSNGVDNRASVVANG